MLFFVTEPDCIIVSIMRFKSAGQSVLTLTGISLAAAVVVVVYRAIHEVNQTTVALTFLVLVLLTASRFRLLYSIYLSILCALLYNFFFLPPIGQFTIHDPQNWIAFAAFLCVGILVSQLSDAARQQAAVSETRRLEVEQLYHFSQQLMLQDDLHSLARSAPSIAAGIFGFRAVAVYVEKDDALFYSDPSEELPFPDELRKTAGMPEPEARRVGNAQVVQLMFGMRSVGSMAVLTDTVSSGRLEAIGALIAIALERAILIERSTRIEAARQSERLRSALLDSVTHDLKTPLTSIRGAASVLAQHPKLEETDRLEMVTVIEEESGRLDALISRAVEMAQLDAGGIQVRVELEDFSSLVSLAIEEAASMLDGHAVLIDIGADLPHIPIDRELIRRVLRHLIENAVRYSPPDAPLRVSARVEGFRLLVTLEDEGLGVDEADQPYIFDKFFRGKAQKGASPGTGMGLAIVKAIMTAHGGGVSAENRIGGGAIFTFWLPTEVRSEGYSG